MKIGQYGQIHFMWADELDKKKPSKELSKEG